ncbi:cation transporter, putative [Trypanosoma brucei gambiense DAL972]|uniref:Cation transporter, putative n=1 Tax=Trypanosoma brucei gambiense (strain MHOM/CI/86/DAL972) TaxID=679716 RepID=D0A885_TRYB9|nr:cation transporter, putative [Trypanosoma brucei gambiense DAL972]CBH17886.1 cation transporter, putative [Trypanosoma brucei gambiense DAL972]|eukprot:XP_011780150.1 cation transporter, putative [Trypanosoma brucei gambiense DAL972]
MLGANLGINFHTDDDHGDHGDHEGHEGHDMGGCAPAAGSYSMGLHIAAIFILLIASFLGTILPIAGNYVPRFKLPPFLIVVSKCISTGVVMSVAVLTLLNHSLHSFMEKCIPHGLSMEVYSAFGLLFMLISALLMHSFDSAMDLLLEGWAVRKEEEKLADGAPQVADSVPTAAALPPTQCGMKRCTAQPGVSCETNGCCQSSPGPAYGATGCCGSRGEAAALLTGARRVMALALMEFGLVVHSIFLGLSVGIASDSRTKVLLVALSFHQFFEGLALGARLAEASLKAKLELFLAILFSISVPVGTAIGAVTMRDGGKSITGSSYATMSAIVNAIGAGILLYIGFVLLLVDFPTDLRIYAGVGTPNRFVRRIAMFVALWVGFGVMALLSKWH